MRYVSHVSRKAPEHKALSLKDSLLILKSKRKKKRELKARGNPECPIFGEWQINITWSWKILVIKNLYLKLLKMGKMHTCQVKKEYAPIICLKYENEERKYAQISMNPSGCWDYCFPCLTCAALYKLWKVYVLSWSVKNRKHRLATLMIYYTLDSV